MTNDPRALILKRAPIGDNQDDCDVLENSVVVGRIFAVPTAPTPPSYESAACPRSDSGEYEQSNHAQSGEQYC
jgi:hypothetical protein